MKLIVLLSVLVFLIKYSTVQTQPTKSNRSVQEKSKQQKLFPPDPFAYNPDRDVKFQLVIKMVNTTDYLKKPIKLNKASSLSDFDGKLLTKLIIHGWYADVNDDAIVLPVRAFLQNKEEYNIITVNWRKGSTDINYFASKDRVEATGKTVAKFVQFLVSEGEADLDNIHIVGFSLGAHIAGFCGKALNGTLGAIFGLEPAMPGFSIKDSKKRLAATDAKYVEVVHTSGGKLGFLDPLGQIGMGF